MSFPFGSQLVQQRPSLSIIASAETSTDSLSSGMSSLDSQQSQSSVAPLPSPSLHLSSSQSAGNTFGGASCEALAKTQEQQQQQQQLLQQQQQQHQHDQHQKLLRQQEEQQNQQRGYNQSLSNFNLIAEAARRAQVAVVARDLEDISLG